MLFNSVSLGELAHQGRNDGWNKKHCIGAMYQQVIYMLKLINLSAVLATF